MIAALLFLALCAVCSAETQTFVYEAGVSFNGNVTLATPDPRFNFRNTKIVGLLGFWFYESIQVSETSTSSSSGSSATFTANGIAGLGLGSTAYLAFFNVSGDATSTPGGASSFDASASLSIVGKSYYKLEEIDASGTIVNTYDLTQAIYTPLVPTPTTSSSGLVSLSITTSAGSATVGITYVGSPVLGKLSNGGATITPTSVESFFEVNGYTYAAATNHLRLIIYVGHVSADASVSGTTSVVAGTGPSQIYIKFSETAMVNGNSAAVTVSGTETVVPTSQVPNEGFSSALSGHSTYKAEARQVVVDFPADAASISYDPSVGFGAPNGAAVFAPFFTLILVAICSIFVSF